MIRKAVTFRASSIGDALMAKYLFENIRASYPEARCALVVAGRGAMIRDLYAAYSWIEVIEANRRTPQKLFYILKNFGGSDLVSTPYTAGTVNLGTKLMARLLAKHGRLFGFVDKASFNNLIYDEVLPFWGRGTAPRLLEQEVLKAAGVPITHEWMNFKYLPQPQLLPRLGLEKGRYLVVHFFAGSQTRGLDPAHQQALVDALVREFPNTTLVFTGTDHDHEFIQKLNLSPNTVMAKTTVQELAQLIDSSLGVVSLGTGPSHMASLMRKPVVVMCVCHGLAWCGMEQYGDAPIAVVAKPELCPQGHNSEGYARCMNAIDMAEVAKKAKEMFAK
jgi:ADP-heptose:LPS heptosyltransferase